MMDCDTLLGFFLSFFLLERENARCLGSFNFIVPQTAVSSRRQYLADTLVHTLFMYIYISILYYADFDTHLQDVLELGCAELGAYTLQQKAGARARIN